MRGLLLSRVGWLALGLAGAGVAGLGLVAARAPQPALSQGAEAPACTSCDARHARLATMRPVVTEGAE